MGMAPILIAAGAVLLNFPEKVTFPNDKQRGTKSKGIAGLHLHEKTALLNSLNDEENPLRFEKGHSVAGKVHRLQSCVSLMVLLALRDSSEPIFIGVAPSSTSPNTHGRRKFANGKEDRLGPIRTSVASVEGSTKASVIKTERSLRSAMGGRTKGKAPKTVKYTNSKAVTGKGEGQMSSAEDNVDSFMDDLDSEASETANRRVTRGAATEARSKNRKGSTRKIVKFAESSTVEKGKGKTSHAEEAAAEEAAELFVDDSDPPRTSNSHTTHGQIADTRTRRGPTQAYTEIEDSETSPPSLKRSAKDDGQSKSKRAKVRRIKSKALVDSSSSDEGDGIKGKASGLEAMPVVDQKRSMSILIIPFRVYAKYILYS
jgi:hypothetical protein